MKLTCKMPQVFGGADPWSGFYKILMFPLLRRNATVALIRTLRKPIWEKFLWPGGEQHFKAPKKINI